jgi:hypothetical protein
MGGVILFQSVLLSTAWLGKIDFNVYSLPALVLCAGAVFIPIALVLAKNSEPSVSNASVVATSLVVAAAAVPWLFSPLRLQAEIGGLFICLAVAFTIIPIGVRRLYDGAAKQLE